MSQDHRLRALARAVYVYLVEDSYSPASMKLNGAGRRNIAMPLQPRASWRRRAIARKQFFMDARLKAGC